MPSSQPRASQQLSVLSTEHFVVEGCSTCYVPGYLMVMPRHAVESLSQMNPAALVALGPTLAAATASIEAVTRPERVYCTLFSEKTRAVHLHLFSRTEWLTARYFAAHPHETEIAGPQLMDWARRMFQKPVVGMERDETLERFELGSHRLIFP